MAQVSQSSKTNQNAQVSGGSRPAVSPQASSQTPTAAQVEVTKPAPATPAQFDLRPPRFWLVLVLLVILIAAGVAVFYFGKTGKQAPGAQKQSSQVPNRATPKTTAGGPSPIAGASPITLPKVEDQKDISILEAYFKKVSTNFRGEFMAMVPKAAAADYKNYLSSSGEAKLTAAQSFYIYLANPANLGNAQFKIFLADVKSDLEKTLGKKLF